MTAWFSACLFLLTLAVLGGVSALSGQSECGCFGSLKAHPGLTASLNVLLLALLVVFRPAIDRQENQRTLAAVVFLAIIGGTLGVLANGPHGDKLMARWQGRTVVLKSSVVTAGEERAGTVRRFVVTVINKGSRDVKLIGGSVSCACTTTHNLPAELPANGEVDLQLELKFVGTPGEFAHDFEIFTDDPTQKKLRGVIAGRVAATAP